MTSTIHLIWFTSLFKWSVVNGGLSGSSISEYDVFYILFFWSYTVVGWCLVSNNGFWKRNKDNVTFRTTGLPPRWRTSPSREELRTHVTWPEWVEDKKQYFSAGRSRRLFTNNEHRDVKLRTTTSYSTLSLNVLYRRKRELGVSGRRR